MLYRNSVVVLISFDLSKTLLLFPPFSCHLSKSEACIGFDLLSGGTFEPADTADAERLGRCRNLKAISQRQFRPSNSREVGKNERLAVVENQGCRRVAGCRLNPRDMQFNFINKIFWIAQYWQVHSARRETVIYKLNCLELLLNIK